MRRRRSKKKRVHIDWCFHFHCSHIDRRVDCSLQMKTKRFDTLEEILNLIIPKPDKSNETQFETFELLRFISTKIFTKTKVTFALAFPTTSWRKQSILTVSSKLVEFLFTTSWSFAFYGERVQTFLSRFSEQVLSVFRTQVERWWWKAHSESTGNW